MCGIAGIIGRLDQTNAAALQRMNRALVHRGPDAEGSWQSPPDGDGRGFLLTHRRLSILDLSPLGAQPMADEITGDVIAYNGEVHNYVELRDRLAALGHHFESTGDTAVVLRDLALNGASALPGLRGMFALAFWDADAHRLRLARDPLGIKPLYVARNRDASAGWSVAFASEVRALLASGLLGTPRLDPQAVASMVWNGFVMAPGTAVSGVELLAAGSTVEFDARGRETHAGDFWKVAPEPPTARIDEDRLAALLEEDVRLHLASDVPLAVFLSGGIDSSAIANLAARAQSAPVHTFTLAFEERELNEGPAARRIAAAIGTQHTEVVLTEPEFVGHLEGALNSLDQPTFDGLNAYYMSRSIRSAGFTVALSGTGGDELFGGYSSFRDLPVLHRWSRRLRFVPRGLLTGLSRLGTAGLRRSGAAVPPQTRWAKLPGMVQRGDDLIALYQLAYALFLPDFQRDLLDPRAPPLRDGLPAAMRDRLLGET
ncbi:MAG: asparagine synthase (glutamine-hydrolyzing), partial [Deltaproteobacteria bacterium]